MESSNANSSSENKMKNLGNKLADEEENNQNNTKAGNIGNELIGLINKDNETK
jgi:hypothetical protein